MFNLADLETFAMVAELGTISGAAQRMSVPKSTVSRRVRRLEDALGQDLLRRSPRSIALTARGEALYRRSAPALRELRSAGDAVTDTESEPSGHLKITTVPGFGHSHLFLSCLRDYGLKYPKMSVNLELTTRLVHLVEEGFDVAVRLHIGELPGDASLMSRRLFTFGRKMYASPAYIAEMGEPRSVEDLHEHRFAGHSIVDVRENAWRHQGELTSSEGLFPQAKWLINDNAALERFILSGAGIAMLPTFEGEHLCERGELIRILPHYEQEHVTASLIWPESRYLAPRVRAFIDHAVESFRARY